MSGVERERTERWAAVAQKWQTVRLGKLVLQLVILGEVLDLLQVRLAVGLETNGLGGVIGEALGSREGVLDLLNQSRTSGEDFTRLRTMLEGRLVLSQLLHQRAVRSQLGNLMATRNIRARLETLSLELQDLTHQGQTRIWRSASIGLSVGVRGPSVVTTILNNTSDGPTGENSRRRLMSERRSVEGADFSHQRNPSRLGARIVVRGLRSAGGVDLGVGSSVTTIIENASDGP